MATAYKSNRSKAGISSVAVGDTGPAVVPFTFTIPAAGFVINDTVTLALIPTNSVLCGFFISSPIIDSNGTPLLTIGIGDSAGAGTFVATTSTTGRTTAFDFWHNAINAFVAGSLPKAYTAEDSLILKITAAPATSATAGTIKGFILYNLNPGNLT